jgi:uncharacterized protein YjbJ (UPF0337 family)
MTADASHQARKGIVDSVAGKAKEVAGALTGQDDLTEEGQLQQADARARREAQSEEAIADAQGKQAAGQLRQVQDEATAQRRDAYAAAGHQERDIRQTAAAERADAELAARRQEEAGHAAVSAQATEDVRETLAEAHSLRAEAEATERDAQRERDQLAGAAAAEERRAAELRAEATNL